MRQMEMWLHRHIFKVGWLTTKNFQTTTILYYAFFLPGVILNQIVIWLAAGIFDVRAERAIRWPEKQEIGTLRLDFVRLSKKASPWRIAAIRIMPFIVGLGIVLYIADAIFGVRDVAATMSDGSLDNVTGALKQLTGTTDFWLWTYLLFTVSNTMTPDFSLFKHYRWAMWVMGAFILALFVLGVGDQIVGSALSGPVAAGLNILSTAFFVIVLFNLVAVGILAAIENTIEYITGDSATFKNGKMIVMTREEARIEREKARKRAVASRSNKKARTADPLLASGKPSIYNVLLPLPDGPGNEAVTQPTLKVLEAPKEDDTGDKNQRPAREEPDVITSTAEREIKFNTSRSNDQDD